MSPAAAFAAPALAIALQLPKPATGFEATVESAFESRCASPLATAEPMADFIQPCMGQDFWPFSPQSNFFAAATAVPLAAGAPEAAALAVAVTLADATGAPLAAAEAVAVALAASLAAAEAVVVADTLAETAAAVVIASAGAPVVAPEPPLPHAARTAARAAEARTKDKVNVGFIFSESPSRAASGIVKVRNSQRIRGQSPSTMAKRKPLPSVAAHRPKGAPVRPLPAPPDGMPRLRFRHGTKYPHAIAWFGFRSFWGHLWSLLAGVIAIEDIDSRDWMRPDEPRDLLERMAAHLGGRSGAATLTEALDRDVWIDFVADTGDDVSVSRAVAELLFDTYAVDDPDAPGSELILPRGDVLLFGGDTAYPVANELEIHNRVIVPFNQVLHKHLDGKPRVLLGVPGNHDWYAGLDGFGRMFRAPLGQVDRSSVVLSYAPGDEPIDTIDQQSQLGHFFEWVEALRIGKRVEKRGALPLMGYTPVQNASYWALLLAPALDLWGPDRQLYAMDTRQRMYFAALRQDESPRGLVMCMADPPYAFLEPHPAGQDILRGLDLAFEHDKLLALAGDTHHYCRLDFARGGTQITAGGGGAFLHPARISRNGLLEPAAEFPGPRASRVLAAQIPLQLALGRAGFILHAALAVAYLPMQKLVWSDGTPSTLATAITGTALAVILVLVAQQRGPRLRKVLGLAALAGAVLAAVPYGMGEAATMLGPKWPYATASLVGLAYGAMVLVGVFVIGVYLMLLTLLGLATDQGFGPLAHPGYKHFVRLRIRKDGRKVNGWVLGKVDPLRASSLVVLVDRFEWKNPHAADEKQESVENDQIAS
jgi:hypothetical protein